MPLTHSNVARKFAQQISEKFSKGRFRKTLLNARPQNEPKDIGEQLRGYLKDFLKAETATSVLPLPEVDWEGDHQKRSERRRNYQVVGIWTFPDAAVLAPFTCAFEFDRERKPNSSGFKDALMKASVHVLSGAYDACVLVYILRSGGGARKYLNDGSDHTERLVQTLQAAGLYVAFISNGSA